MRQLVSCFSLAVLTHACSPPCPAGLVPTADGACVNPSDGGASDASLACDATGAEVCDGLDNDCSRGADDPFECVRGQSTACTTSCGSTGTGTCSATCGRPTGEACAVPAEVCNGIDDDCDGAIDEGVQTLSGRIDLPGAVGRVDVTSVGDGFVVVYETEKELRARKIDGRGQLVGADLRVSTRLVNDFDVSMVNGLVYFAWRTTQGLYAEVADTALAVVQDARLLLPYEGGQGVWVVPAQDGRQALIAFEAILEPERGVFYAPIQAPLATITPVPWITSVAFGSQVTAGPEEGEPTLLYMGTGGLKARALDRREVPIGPSFPQVSVYAIGTDAAAFFIYDYGTGATHLHLLDISQSAWTERQQITIPGSSRTPAALVTDNRAFYLLRGEVGSSGAINTLVYDTVPRNGARETTTIETSEAMESVASGIDAQHRILFVATNPGRAYMLGCFPN